MSVTKLKLTVDSHVQSEGELEKLAHLHSLIVREVSVMDITERVKVTLECDRSGARPWDDSESRLSGSVPSPEGAQGPANGAFLKLSERQRQIAVMLCNYYSIKRIANVIFVSENTVKKHVQNIKKALDIECSGADFIYTLKQLLTANPFDETIPH
ncbi:helix-turn-helix transcriptional regulator [Paenibacillus ehimensis]|uniref:LuxR C-terminal-related transcriptional regulator n=1 Tax=Paenibacillus ehimensis TaxID=79264 RepID=A0ABT8V7P2_9BACL|nr:LuxR C-terminal-related transcriptional regulator [Paenibacillus ehimensis]MDO3676489.1 LuxR C-terminal-related transcriptional regulator [Paenibacillus ehimensis]MEC0208385.1 LuxR C-terminal-related transcriptional regulator [Paenibacillus ehimensis]